MQTKAYRHIAPQKSNSKSVVFLCALGTFATSLQPRKKRGEPWHTRLTFAFCEYSHSALYYGSLWASYESLRMHQKKQQRSLLFFYVQTKAYRHIAPQKSNSKSVVFLCALGTFATSLQPRKKRGEPWHTRLTFAFCEYSHSALYYGSLWASYESLRMHQLCEKRTLKGPFFFFHVQTKAYRHIAPKAKASQFARLLCLSIFENH